MDCLDIWSNVIVQDNTGPLSKVVMSHELCEEEKGVDFFKKSRIRPLPGVLKNISFTETQVARQLWYAVSFEFDPFPMFLLSKDLNACEGDTLFAKLRVNFSKGSQAEQLKANLVWYFYWNKQREHWKIIHLRAGFPRYRIGVTRKESTYVTFSTEKF